MLELKNIVKHYDMGDTSVEALRGISLNFRKSDFVSILGPSGCGKTTLLNIIGGLDRYTSGDLVINGVSTKAYRDMDWDIYRNNAIGFVFQNYNLIPHQTVLSNVELALTLAGKPKAERRKMAIDVLKRVGLGDQLHKKPNQMSGGQMQRVAIARALVNNPDILLADEPTGALDSETSVQIMELLKEIAKDRLVIMVTHNSELAQKYSTRIIRLLDGKVVDDTSPCLVVSDTPKPAQGKKKKISMSFFTALSLSLKNLLTKKTRTLLTAFAGSIGIIGIALILSLSSGMQTYINNLEQDTLSTYPIELENQSMDMTGMMTSMMSNNTRGGVQHDLDKVYANNIMTDMLTSRATQTTANDLSHFKQYLMSEEGKQFAALTNSIQYGYDLELQIYASGSEVLQVNPSSVYSQMGRGGSGGISLGSGDVWEELLENEVLLKSQYDVLAGRWPDAYDEVVLVVDKNNELSDTVLYSLGLLDSAELEKVLKGQTAESAAASFNYEDILALTFKLVLNTDYYAHQDDQWVDMRDDESYMLSVLENALEIKVVGILRPSEEAAATSISGSVGYTAALNQYVIEAIHASDIAQEQLNNPEIDVFTGVALTDDGYEDNLSKLGIVDFSQPSVIRLYPKDFEAKDTLADLIEAYNTTQEEAGHAEYAIHYSDMVGLLTSSVSSIINIITYVLIAFVAISLVVSSIMIGIITYISVLERTKEIGILRSIGASKKDISRVFNAETVIIGLVAGGLGVLITMLLNLPINTIIKALTGISGIAALPLYGAVALIAISMLLTVVAGLIPAKVAAKKDPVEALRSE